MSEATRQAGTTNCRVSFELSEGMAQEVQRVLDLTDLGSRPEVFRRAFTLLRIHLDAARQGRVVYMSSPEKPEEKYIITLPFNVELEQTARSSGHAVSN